MRFTAYMVVLFGILVMSGGLVGYLFADSLISLVAGAVFGALLFASGLGLFKKSKNAFFVALGSSILLFLFFGYRYFSTMKMMPAGMMAILSFIMVLLLLTTKAPTE